MADENGKIDEEEIEERIQKLLEEENKRERVNKIIPVVLIGFIGTLMVVAVVGIFYRIFIGSADIEWTKKKEIPVAVDNLKAEREKFDLSFNPKFSEIARKVDFIESWFLNEKKDKLTIMVKQSWYNMENRKKISALKILGDEFKKIYLSSDFLKKTNDSPTINLINYNGRVIAVYDKEGASLKELQD